MKQTILAISGKPGLYKLVSRAKNSLIVEALDGTGKRIPAFGTDRITSLADIAMFTETEDVPLMKVLASLRDLRKERTPASTTRRQHPRNCTTISRKSYQNGTRSAFTTVISRSSCSGMTSSSMQASQTLKRRWHPQRVITLTTERKNNQRKGTS